MNQGIKNFWIAALALAAFSGAPSAHSQVVEKHHDSARSLRQAAHELDDQAGDLYNRVRREVGDPNGRERYALEHVADLAQEASDFHAVVERSGTDRDDARRAFRSVTTAMSDARETFDDLDPSRAAWGDLREVQDSINDVRSLLANYRGDGGGGWLSDWQRQYLRNAAVEMENFADNSYDAAQAEYRSQWGRRWDRLEEINRLGALYSAARDFRFAMSDEDSSRRRIESRYNNLSEAYRAAAVRGGIFGRTVGYNLNNLGNRLNDVERVINR